MVKEAPGELAEPAESPITTDDLVYVAEELMEALKEGSAKRVAECLKAAMDMCQSSDEAEGEI